MKSFKTRFVECTSYFFILLFCYASISKIIDFENFQVQIAQSPLLSAYAGFVSYIIIGVEIIIVILLCLNKSRWVGLYSSVALMSAFTVYIYLILNYSDFVPCSCGGILENLGWTEHLIFNILCVIFGITAVFISEITLGISNKIIATILIASNVLSCSIVGSLFINSEHIIKHDNNFTRRFLMHPVIEKRKVILEDKYFYFAGIGNEAIYLANRRFPQQVIKVDTLMTSLQKLNIDLNIAEFPFKKIETKVVEPFYYIYDGTIPLIKKGLLGDSKPRTVSQDDIYFSQLEIINNNDSYALRTQSSTTKNLLLASLRSAVKNKNIKLYPGFLEKQSDGVFDSDGVLNVDRSNGDIIYMYSYRNQFIVADSNFSIKHRLNTIDTVKTAQIKSVSLPEGKHKMEKPPLKVNGFSAVHRNLLFNQSFLKGKFESEKRWKKSKVVDVYKTDSNLYIGSFYLENREENIVTDIVVTDKFLYAIVGNQLIQYQLTRPLLKYIVKGEAENLDQE